MSAYQINMSVSSTHLPELFVNIALLGTSRSGISSMNGTTMMSVGAIVTVSEPGPFFSRVSPTSHSTGFTASIHLMSAA